MNLTDYKNGITDEDLFHAKQNLKIVYSYIKKYESLYPNYSLKDVIEKIRIDDINKANEYYTTIDRLSGTQVQLFVQKYLSKNENELKKSYLKYKNKNIKLDENQYYTYNLHTSSNLLVKNLLFYIRKDFKNNNISIAKEEEYEFLKSSLENLGPYLEASLKEDNINILLHVKDFLCDYDILSKLVSVHNKQQKELWLEDLCYDLIPSKRHPKDISVKGFLSRESLEKLPVEELSILNMFWQNKYVKQLDNINLSYFILQQLYTIDNPDKIDGKLLKNIMVKYKFLKAESNDIYNLKSSNKYDPNKTSYKAEDYRINFSRLLPNLKNNFLRDLNQCIDFNFAQKNIYNVKSNLMCSTIVNLTGTKKLKNWGYIDDKYNLETDEFDNKSDDNILIGFDYPGLNKPVKVHIPKSLVKTALLNMNNTNLIPIYEGNKDYDINFQNLPAHIVLPFEKRHKEFLRKIDLKNLNKDNFKTHILAHTAFLANPDKFPEHLKSNDKKGNKKRVRKYIDLYNGKIFVENGKNFVPEGNIDNER